MSRRDIWLRARFRISNLTEAGFLGALGNQRLLNFLSRRLNAITNLDRRHLGPRRQLLIKPTGSGLRFNNFLRLLNRKVLRLLGGEPRHSRLTFVLGNLGVEVIGGGGWRPSRLRHPSRVLLCNSTTRPFHRSELSRGFGSPQQAHFARSSPCDFGPGGSRELAADTAAQGLGGRFRFGSEG